MEAFVRMRIIREVLCLTQKQVADLADVPACYVSQIENGKEVSEVIFAKVEKALMSHRDKMYPEGSYLRNMYTLNLHVAMLNNAETINDKLYFTNKVSRDASYVMGDILESQKAAERDKRNKAYRGYRW